jgi:hypothetical protein
VCDEALQYFEWMPKDKSSFLSKMAPADIIKFYHTMSNCDNVEGEKQVDKSEIPGLKVKSVSMGPILSKQMTSYSNLSMLSGL